MDKNRIEGAAEQDERAMTREALVIKTKCVTPAVVQRGVRSYLGRSRLVPERATVLSRNEKSAEAVIATGVGAKGRTRRRADGHVARNYSALEARAAGATRRRAR
jgi:hypothetical protein